MSGGNTRPRATARGRAEGGGGGRRRRPLGSGGIWGPIFVAPQTLLFAAFFLIPVVIAVALAFMEVRPTSMSWVGLDNFRRALGDQLFHKALINTSIFTAVVVVFWLGKALLVAFLARAAPQTISFLSGLRARYSARGDEAVIGG